MQGQTPEQQVMFGFHTAFDDAANDQNLSPVQRFAVMESIIENMRSFAIEVFERDPNAGYLVAQYLDLFIGEHVRDPQILRDIFADSGLFLRCTAMQNNLADLHKRSNNFVLALAYRQ